MPAEFSKMPDDSLPPFWETFDFWIFLILGIVGLILSYRAFKEAARAKDAASAAGRSVKIQTVTIELTEILQRLDKLDSDISFSEARDLLSEVSRRLRRLLAPFSKMPDISENYQLLKDELKQSKEALDEVRPPLTENSEPAQNAVYYALQGHFGSISEFIAEITGLLESKTINSEENVTSK